MTLRVQASGSGASLGLLTTLPCHQASGHSQPWLTNCRFRAGRCLLPGERSRAGKKQEGKSSRKMLLNCCPSWPQKDIGRGFVPDV
jgi:hypothetical protein